MTGFHDASCMGGVCPILVMNPEGGYDVQQVMMFQPCVQSDMTMSGGDFSQGDFSQANGFPQEGAGTMNGMDMYSNTGMNGVVGAGMSNMVATDMSDAGCFKL